MKKLLVGLLLLPVIGLGYTITHNDYTSGSVVSSSGQNTNENNIVNLINGNLDSTNISAGGIKGSNVASNTISSTSIVSNTITGSSANSGGSAGNIQQGTISTPDFRTNAVSTTVYNGFSGTSDTTTVITISTLTTVGGNVVGWATVTPTCTTAPCVFTYSITRDGTTINGGTCKVTLESNSERNVCTLNISDSPSASTVHYKLSGSVDSGTGSINSANYSFVVLELRA